MKKTNGQITLEEIKELAEDIASLKDRRAQLKGKNDEIEQQLIKLGYKNAADALKKNTKRKEDLEERKQKLDKEFDYFKDQYGELL